MKRYLAICLFNLLILCKLSSLAFGQVELSGTEGVVDFGQLIQVKAINKDIKNNKENVSYQWYVFEDGKPNKHFITWPDGTQIFFAAGISPHKVLVAVAVNYPSTSDLVIREITVGVPSPPPTITTISSNRFGLAKIAFTLTMSVPEAARSHETVLALAKSYTDVANRISQSISKQAAGISLTDEDIKVDIPSMISAVAVSNAKALGFFAPSWQGWNASYGNEIFSMYKSKKIITVEDFRDAFLETAEGLKQVK